MDVSRIFDEFPSPSFRGHQRQALKDIKSAFVEGNDIVLVRAPTGSGKSLLARAIAGCARHNRTEEVAPSQAYYTTPQVAQIDDVEEDSLLSSFNVVRGKSNYQCILPEAEGTPVHKAPCNIDDEFDCSLMHRCPYYEDKNQAQDGHFAAMTLAYFMQQASTNSFQERDVVVIDEAHGLPKWAELYGTIEVSKEKIPDWHQVRPQKFDTLLDCAQWAGHLMAHLENFETRMKDRTRLEPDEGAMLRQIEQLRMNIDWFLSEYHEADTEARWLFEQPDGAGGPVIIKPINPERLLHHTIWERGSKFALLSATILNKEAFCRRLGLPIEDTALVEIDHTFPLENRPLYDVTCGKMTYEHRDETIPEIAKTIARLMRKHPGGKGLIHCHSYAIQDQLSYYLQQYGVGDRIRDHNSDDRDRQLERWKNETSSPEVFLSVKMEEALDLKGDLARWQVLCKAPYPNTKDSRVANRLENDEWPWYYRTTLTTVIQACGRIVRAPDDYGATYLADDSLLDLFERARSDMPSWFEAQVDRMSEPSLPPAPTARR